MGGIYRKKNPFTLGGADKFVKKIGKAVHKFGKAGQSEYCMLECIVGQHSGTCPKTYYS
jgi:hypothetical protein